MKTPEILVNPHYQDRYFDVVNALNEAKTLYVQNCKIVSQIQEKQRLRIGETGFGAGRVLLTLLHELNLVGSGQNWELEFCSVELHPLPASRQAEILGLFQGQDHALDKLIKKLNQAYAQLDFKLFHSWQNIELTLPFGTLRLRLWFGEALEMLKALETEQSLCDVWCLEGHGPKANPQIWRKEVIQAVGRLSPTGAYCATFTVSADLRRELRAAGFNTQRMPGLGGKKEVLRGQKRAPQAPQKQIELVAHNAQWHTAFESIKNTLLKLKLPRLLTIEHVGSTPIPDLPARPELDLALIVSSQSRTLVPELLRAGYAQQGSPNAGHLEFVSQEPVSHRLYLFDCDAPLLHQQLYLRDYLCAFPERVQAYARVKQDMVARFPQDDSAYQGAKTKILNQLSAEARQQQA